MTFVRFNAGSSMSIMNGMVRVHWRSGRIDQLDVPEVTEDSPAVNVDEFLVHIRVPGGIVQIAKADDGDRFLVATKLDWWAEISPAERQDPVPGKQTSPEIAALAGKYLALTDEKLEFLFMQEPLGGARREVMADLRKLAASALGQVQE